MRVLDAPRHAADEEDVALSAFNSFWIKAQAGRFPDLTDGDSLWRLLAAFTLRKAAHHVRDAGRLRCGGGMVRVDSAVLEEMLASEPGPALASEIAEEYDRLLGFLQDLNCGKSLFSGWMVILWMRSRQKSRVSHGR